MDAEQPGQNEAWLQRLTVVECRDATYKAKEPALVMARAAGSTIYDVAGRAYIDLCAGFGVLALGHNPAEHRPAFAARLDVQPSTIAPITHGMGDVYPSAAKISLLETLLGALPTPFTKAALALTGAQAVELAVKTALLATRRSGFIVFQGAYHGLDLGILPLTAKAAFRAPFKGFCVDGQVERLAFGCGQADLGAAVERLRLRGQDLAAVLVEPVQGRAGIRPAPPGWLRQLRGFCDQQQALLIYDEVFTGLGRSGALTYASQVPSDLLCLGKALGGGFPVSACVGTEAAMAAWPESQGEAIHTGTFFGHPLSCEIADLTLQSILSQRLWERSSSLGDKALAWLRRHIEAGEGRAVRDIRGVGLMLAIEFSKAGAGAQLMDRLRQRGVIALASGEYGESLSLTPALTIAWEQLEQALVQIHAAIMAP